MAGVAGTMKTTSATFATAGKSMSMYVSAPLIAIGAMAIAASMDIKKASRVFEQELGVTGQSLDNLMGSFKRVFATVPEGTKQVAETMTLLKQRTDATGKPLEDLTTTLLNLARIQGTEVAPLTDSVTRAFAGWNIPAKDMNKTLNELYTISTKTGVGVQRMTDATVKFGAPMRSLGFSFEQTAAMVAQFDKAGANTEKTMMGLQMGLARMAKEGVKDLPGHFAELVKSIKNAGSAAEANTIAVQVFGARAGIKMADAIRTGKMSIEDLVKVAQSSPKSIDDVAFSTLKFSEKLDVLKHKVELALEPLGSKLMDALKSLLPYLEKGAKGLGDMTEAFSKMSPKTQGIILAIAGAATAIGPLLIIIGKVAGGISALSGVIGTLSGPVGWVVLAVAALAAVAVLIYKNWDKIKEALKPVIDMFKTYVVPVLQQVWAIIKGSLLAALDNLKQAWANLSPYHKQILEGLKMIAIAIGIGLVAPIAIGIAAIIAIVTVFAKIVEVVTWVVAQVTYFCSHFGEIMGSLPGLIGEAIGRLVRVVIDGFVSFVTGAIEWVSTLPGRVWDFLSQLPEKASTAAGQFKDAFINFIQDLPDKISGIFDRVINFLKGLGSRLWDMAKDVAGSFWEGFKRGLGISSPSYIEQAFMAMEKQSKQTLSAIKGDMAGFAGLNFPTLAYAGGYGYGPASTTNNSKTSVTVNATVRDETDVQLLAERIYWMSKTRGR